MGQNPVKQNVSKADTEKKKKLLLEKLNDPTITRLDLRNQNISILPPVITTLQSLTWLNLPNNHITTLPEYFYDLTNLVTLRLLGNQITTVSPTISILVNLTSLDLSKNFLKKIPSSFGCLVSMKDLNFHWNRVEEVTDTLSNLKSLKMLNVSLNRLLEFPEITNSTLEILDLSHNRLPELPQCCKHIASVHTLNLAGNCLQNLSADLILGLKSVKTFDLQCNELKSLPDTLDKLGPTLKFLRLKCNQLKSLPPAVCGLITLEELEASQNFITDLPKKGMGRMTKLQSLFLYMNQIKELPDDLNGMVNLRELGVAFNELTSLPTTIGGIPKLVQLFVNNNHISVLDPNMISGLTMLQEASLNCNEIRVFPDTISCLVQLRRLDCSNNKIKNFPSIVNCTNLNWLDLSANRFTESPKTIFEQSSITFLNLFGNQIPSLPPEIGKLVNLKKFHIGYNRFTELPDDMEKLVNLTDFFASGNCFTTIPAVICKITSLVELSLSNNLILEIPTNISNLVNLKVLHLNANKIVKIPVALGSLHSLTELDLAHNEIYQLPPEFGGLVELVDLDVSGNMLTYLPDTFLQSCRDMHQLRIGYNHLRRIPRFESEKSAKKAPWINFTGNELLLEVYTGKINEIKFEKQEKKYQKLIFDKRKQRKIKMDDNSDSDDEENTEPGNPSAISADLAIDFEERNDVYRKITPVTLFNNSEEERDPYSGSVTIPTGIPQGSTSLATLSLFTSPGITFLNSPSEPGRSRRTANGGNTKTTEVQNENANESNYDEPEIPSEQPQQQQSSSPTTRAPIIQLSPTQSSRVISSEKKRPATKYKLTSSGKRTATQVSLGDVFQYRLKLGWSEMRGRRPDMQDTINIFLNFRQNPQRTLICCFDGHSGEKSAEWAAKRVHQVLAARIEQMEQKKLIHADIEKGHWENLPEKDFDEKGAEGNITEKDPEHNEKITSEKISEKLTEKNFANTDRSNAVEKDSEKFSEKIYEQGIFQSTTSMPIPISSRKTGEKLRSPETPHREFESIRRTPDQSPSPQIHSTPSSGQQSLANTPNKRKKRDVQQTQQKTLGTSSGGSPLANSSGTVTNGSECLSEKEYIHVMVSSFKDLHDDITQKKFEDGTAALAVIVEHDHDRLIVANSGDQRAVLARGKSAIALTNDHKPDDPNEKLRVYDVGGFVNEQKRVDGILALSRALGDNDLQPHVTYEPEVYFVDLKPEDKFLIVACDGLWDVVSNQKAVEITEKYKCPIQAATALRDMAYALGSGDNISVIVYRLDNAVTFSDLNLRTRNRKNENSESSSEENMRGRQRQPQIKRRRSLTTTSIPTTTNTNTVTTTITTATIASSNPSNSHTQLSSPSYTSKYGKGGLRAEPNPRSRSQSPSPRKNDISIYNSTNNTNTNNGEIGCSKYEENDEDKGKRKNEIDKKKLKKVKNTSDDD